MTFRWSMMLLGLLVLPALIVVYVGWQRRAAAHRLRLASLGLRSSGPATRLGWRRHLPPAVLLAAVTVLLVAIARPEVVLAVPERTGTVIVAIDVSNSMAADDVAPTRLDAARNGAGALIEALPASVEVGVVAFGDGAQVVAQPGDDRDAALEAIERLTPSGGTSTGAGLYSALEAIVGEPLALGDDLAGGAADDPIDPAAVDLGYFPASEVVVFSDGEDTSDIDPLEVADLLAAAGVRVTTVAVGTEAGAVIEVDGFSMSTSVDSAQLEEVAAATNGAFHEAADAGALATIADGLDLEWRTDGEPTEITGLLAALAAGLLVVGAALAAVFLGRVI